jgi:hypothetical protein
VFPVRYELNFDILFWKKVKVLQGLIYIFFKCVREGED